MLLYENDEQYESIYVIDMGEAKLSTKIRTSMVRVGTLLYMSPERLNEENKAGSHQSDIW